MRKKKIEIGGGGDKKLIVLPLDENSKEISQILANDTARKILETLAEKPLSATEIADSLDLALTTVQYDIKKLQDAGLIRVVDTRASEKLKEVKVYGPEEKFIVIAPKSVKRSDALAMLKKILPLIFVAAVCVFGAYHFMQLPGGSPGEQEGWDGIGDADIKKFSSQQELNAFIKYSAESGEYYAYRGVFEGFAAEDTDALSVQAPGAEKSFATTGGDEGAGAEDFSTTNIQVEGVDEADIVKNDGKYIYVISGKKVVIIDAYPAENAEILSEIEFDEQPSEIFINGDKLVVFTQEYDHGAYRDYYYGSSTKTNVLVYDLSDREVPVLEWEISADGNYFDSRMIGDYVYVIVNEPIYYYTCPVYRGEEVDLKCIAHDIKVPETTVNDKKIDETFPDIYYWDIYDYSYRFTTILAVNVRDEKINKRLFVMGTSQDMFVSLENIYLTRTKWMSQRELQERVYDEVVIPSMPGEKQDEIKEIEDSGKSFYVKRYERALAVKNYLADNNDSETGELQDKINKKTRDLQKEFEKNQEQTVINKIAIKDGTIVPTASGSVPGTVLNQFSMDEYKDNFRIATTTRRTGWFGDSSRNNVYVLDEDMEITGKLEDLAPGESIYSARFMGERCYLVTFRKIDPLFVIDLSDPKNPEVLGKLKIPGYSDYLHPYDENHLIGIGKETVESKVGDFSWYQGVKISLFDVSDVSKPKEIAKYEIGDRGTDSYALSDHKAFLFSKSKDLLVIPILLAEIDEEKYPGGVSPSQHGDYVWQGAYVFKLTVDDGFELKGRVTHSDAYEFIKSGWYYHDSPTSVKRSLYMDDVLYTISNKKVKMNDLDDLDEINEVELPYEGNGEYYYG